MLHPAEQGIENQRGNATFQSHLATEQRNQKLVLFTLRDLRVAGGCLVTVSGGPGGPPPGVWEMQ